MNTLLLTLSANCAGGGLGLFAYRSTKGALVLPSHKCNGRWVAAYTLALAHLAGFGFLLLAQGLPLQDTQVLRGDCCDDGRERGTCAGIVSASEELRGITRE